MPRPVLGHTSKWIKAHISVYYNLGTKYAQLPCHMWHLLPMKVSRYSLSYYQQTLHPHTPKLGTPVRCSQLQVADWLMHHMGQDFPWQMATQSKAANSCTTRTSRVWPDCWQAVCSEYCFGGVIVFCDFEWLQQANNESMWDASKRWTGKCVMQIN